MFPLLTITSLANSTKKLHDYASEITSERMKKKICIKNDKGAQRREERDERGKLIVKVFKLLARISIQ